MVGSPQSASPVSPSSPLVQAPPALSPLSSPSSAESPPVEIPIRKRTSASPGPTPKGQPSSSPLPIPRSGSVPKQAPSRTSPSPTHHGAGSGMTPRKQIVGTPSSKPLVGKSPNSSPSALKSGSSRKKSPATQRQAAQVSPKGSSIPLTAAAQALSAQARSEMTVGLHQQAFAGFSNTNADKGLARGAAVGTFRRALSNIEPLVTQSPDSSSILTALARHSRSGMGVPITDLSEPGAETKQIIRVQSSPAILAMGLPRKGSLLASTGFQLGAAGTSPVFRRNSGGGFTPLRGKSPPISSSPTGLPTIPGSPTKTSHSTEASDPTVDPDNKMKPLKGLFTVGSCSPKTSEDMFLLGRNSPNATKNGEKPAVVSQGKHYVLE